MVYIQTGLYFIIYIVGITVKDSVTEDIDQLIVSIFLTNPLDCFLFSHVTCTYDC